jgi:hypothetical protein
MSDTEYEFDDPECAGEEEEEVDDDHDVFLGIAVPNTPECLLNLATVSSRRACLTRNVSYDELLTYFKYYAIRSKPFRDYLWDQISNNKGEYVAKAFPHLIDCISLINLCLWCFLNAGYEEEKRILAKSRFFPDRDQSDMESLLFVLVEVPNQVRFINRVARIYALHFNDANRNPGIIPSASTWLQPFQQCMGLSKVYREYVKNQVKNKNLSFLDLPKMFGNKCKKEHTEALAILTNMFYL